FLASARIVRWGLPQLARGWPLSPPARMKRGDCVDDERGLVDTAPEEGVALSTGDVLEQKDESATCVVEIREVQPRSGGVSDLAVEARLSLRSLVVAVEELWIAFLPHAVRGSVLVQSHRQLRDQGARCMATVTLVGEVHSADDAGEPELLADSFPARGGDSSTVQQLRQHRVQPLRTHVLRSFGNGFQLAAS